MAQPNVSRRDPTLAVRIGVPSTPLSDLYYRLMSRKWRWLLGGLAVGYIAINAVFAGLYALDPGGFNGADRVGIVEGFYFSVQTFATIGYGTISPRSLYANLLVTFEALAGIIYTAIATGLVFAKFSQPSARVLFSQTMVIGQRHGKPVLQFRMANARGNALLEASVRVTLLKTETTPEGHSMRRLHDVLLDRTTSPLFTLSWLVMHEIDEESPFFGETAESLAADEVLVIVTLTGLEGTFSQTVHARHFYEFHDIRWNRRFVDIISRTDDGRVQMDLRRFDETVEDVTE